MKDIFKRADFHHKLHESFYADPNKFEYYANKLAKYLPSTKELLNDNTNIYQKIKKSGYAKLKFLNEEQVNDINKYLNTKFTHPYHTVKDYSKIGTKNIKDKLKFEIKRLLSKSNLRKQKTPLQASYNGYDILKAPHLLELITNTKIINLIGNLLGCKPILSHFSIAVNYPSNNSSFNTSTTFHRDNNCYRAFLLEIYLTPVNDLNDGPHIIIDKTHNFEEKENKEFNKNFEDKYLTSYNRFHHNSQWIIDSEINCKKYFKNSIVPIYGKSGEGLIENSRILHKGTPPQKEKARKVFWAIYTMIEGHSIYDNHFANGNKDKSQKKLKFSSIKNRINLNEENQYLLRNFYE